jgi:hypothetical protein
MVDGGLYENAPLLTRFAGRRSGFSALSAPGRAPWRQRAGGGHDFQGNRFCGVLLVVEHEPDGIDRVVALFLRYQRVAIGDGRLYAAVDHAEVLRRAGVVHVEVFQRRELRIRRAPKLSLYGDGECDFVPDAYHGGVQAGRNQHVVIGAHTSRREGCDGRQDE